MNQIKIDFLGKDYFAIIDLILRQNSYLRELSEKSGLAPSSVHKILQKLKAKRMVFEKKQKNKSFFSINKSSALARETTRLMFVSKILDSRAFRKLISLKPKKVYLFGSAANGTIHENSDVDLAAFFNKKPDTQTISKIKRQFSEYLSREIDLFILSEEKSASSDNEKSETLKSIENSVLLYEAK